MWPRRSHMVAPLTRMNSNKSKYKWIKFEQDAFDKIKRTVARHVLSTYTYFIETFKIHTDASTLQLGAVISQKGKYIAFYRRKVTDSQQRYTVTEREILSILENLKEFRTILLGQKLRIYNDHNTLHVRIFKPIDY